MALSSEVFLNDAAISAWAFVGEAENQRPLNHHVPNLENSRRDDSDPIHFVAV